MSENISLGESPRLMLDESPAEVASANTAKTLFDRSGADARPGFDDRKAPGAFRTIGEVAQALNIRQHVLRYWEEHFPMLRPVKRSGNRRYYRPEDVELVETIDRLVHHQGYTLRGARLALEEARQNSAPRQAAPKSEAPVPAPAALPVRLEPNGDSGRLVRELMAIRATLAAVLEA